LSCTYLAHHELESVLIIIIIITIIIEQDGTFCSLMERIGCTGLSTDLYALSACHAWHPPRTEVLSSPLKSFECNL